MNVMLLVITDGRRSCLERTLESFALCTSPETIFQRAIVNDCPDPDYASWIDTLGFDVHVRPSRTKRGFAGAIAAGWAAIAPDATHVFHLEDDFLFTRYVNIRAMVTVLDQHPHLAQMALRRQAWSDPEKAAGGVVEQNPDSYTDCTDGTNSWLEHRLFFTTNPSLYPRRTMNTPWPVVPESEGRFSRALLADQTARCGYWGKRNDDPWVIHLGVTRLGSGY